MLKEEKGNCKFLVQGGSLLGAVRSGDIIPWDYDVDIGIYQHEINKVGQFTTSDSNFTGWFQYILKTAVWTIL